MRSGNVGDGVLSVVGRLQSAAAHVARHVQLAALDVRDVLEAALPIDVPRPDVRRIDGKPNSLETEFFGQLDATSHQFGADAEILESGADDDQHFALLRIDGKYRGMADDWATRVQLTGGADIPVCQMCRVFLADRNVCPTCQSSDSENPNSVNHYTSAIYGN